MSEKDSIERMMVVWQPKAVKAYKRRKMNDSSASLDTSTTPNKKRSLLLLDDMEIDSDGKFHSLTLFLFRLFRLLSQSSLNLLGNNLLLR